MALAEGGTNHEDTRYSGAVWLGLVPKNWNIKKMKYLFRDHSRKGMPNAELLSVTQNQGVVPRTWVENRMVMPSGNLDSFKFIETGDFAISLRSFEGGLEYCHHDGIISPAYTVLKRRKENLLPAYYRYLFKSAAFISELQTSIVGIREGKNISFEELSHSLMPIPSQEEQQAIARFLDDKTDKIDRAVKIKEGQIALLRERKQIIIQEAVTKGLNPNAPMKDSGIDWIGQIPAHWGKKRLKFITKILKRIIGHEGPDVLSITQRGVVVKDIESGEGQLAADYSNYQIVNVGDFAMNHMDLVTGYVDISKFHGVTSPDYRVFRNVSTLLRDEFLLLLFQMGYKARIFFKYGQGVHTQGRWRFPADSFNNFFVPIPPLEEQSSIVSHVETQSAKVEAAIELKQRQIEALKEYKATLINAAVTGKIKVI